MLNALFAAAAVLAAALTLLYALFRRKLAQGAAAWQSVGDAMGLRFTPLGSQIGRLEGTLEGFDVDVEVTNTEVGPEEGLATYTWIRVHGVGEGAATAELEAATHGFVGRCGEGVVEWMRGGIVFDPRTLEKGIRDAIAAAQAATDADIRVGE